MSHLVSGLSCVHASTIPSARQEKGFFAFLLLINCSLFVCANYEGAGAALFGNEYA